MYFQLSKIYDKLGETFARDYTVTVERKNLSNLDKFSGLITLFLFFYDNK